MRQQDVKEWLESNLKECITTPAWSNMAEATEAAEAAGTSAPGAARPCSASSCAAESRDGEIVALSELDGDDVAELCLLGRSVICPGSRAFLVTHCSLSPPPPEPLFPLLPHHPHMTSLPHHPHMSRRPPAPSLRNRPMKCVSRVPRLCRALAAQR